VKTGEDKTAKNKVLLASNDKKTLSRCQDTGEQAQLGKRGKKRDLYGMENIGTGGYHGFKATAVGCTRMEKWNRGTGEGS